MKDTTKASGVKVLYETYIEKRQKAQKEIEYCLSKKEGGAVESASPTERSK